MFASIRTKITSIRAHVYALTHNEEGATAIEYGMIAALVSVLIVPALILLGPKLRSAFESINTAIPG